MKKSNKILAIILAIIMVISIIPITASAATSGTCGENVTWTYDDTTYTLTISGTGPMEKNGYGLLFAALTPKVQKVIISDGVTSICKAAFQQCLYLTDVSISNTVTVIDNHAFYNCPELTNITLPNSVISIGNYAFGLCDGFTSIALPDSVTTIGNYAFRGCKNLTSITFPDSVTSIGEGAFAWCTRLADVKIPDGITTIKEETFDGCTRLLSITIPKSVTTIEAYAFRDCHLLMNVYYLGTKEEWEAISIEQSNTTNKYLLNTTIHYHTHNYSLAVTAPTCTEQGYTTYTCECGYTYVGDYVDAKGHTPAEPVKKWPVNPTCTKDGSVYEVVLCSVCDEEISQELITLKATGHADKNGNGYCDACDELLDPSVECNHNCHKRGIVKFFWEIGNFFNRIFRTKRYCKCGAAHY